jgi:hypothetical protein
MSVPECPYCGRPAKAVDGTSIYPNRPELAHKMFWRCDPCSAWVGCHAGTMVALGRLANAELRAAKQRAHVAFDPLWQGKMKRDGCSKAEARSAGYQWLAAQLGIETQACHIGMFDVDQCQRVVEVCTSISRNHQQPRDSATGALPQTTAAE